MTDFISLSFETFFLANGGFPASQNAARGGENFSLTVERHCGGLTDGSGVPALYTPRVLSLRKRELR